MSKTSYTLFVIVHELYNAVLTGFVLSTLWGWFVVSQFDLEPLSMPVAYGLSLIPSYFQQMPSDMVEREYSEVLIYGYVLTTVKTIMALLLGWITTLFI